MYSVKSRTLLESVLTPSKLLFLVDAPLRKTGPDIATCLGTILSSYPSASANYMREVAITWTRYRPDPDPDDPPGSPRTALTVGQLKMRYAEKIFETLLVLVPPASHHHAKALVKLLTKVAAMTAFSRTGTCRWKK